MGSICSVLRLVMRVGVGGVDMGVVGVVLRAGTEVVVLR